jgi:plastocyanin
MKKCVELFTLAVAVGSLTTLSASEITGKVKLEGKPPAEIDIPVGQTCGPNPKPLTTRHYVVSSDGGLANVFVYIKNAPQKKYDPPATAAELDQADCQYQPFISAIQVGQKLKIKNSDSFLHNVNTSTSRFKNHQFNIAQPSKGMEAIKTFDNPELPLKFLCNVHQWMISYIAIFDHPFFAVTDKDGNFTIGNLPPGKYTLAFKHMKIHGPAKEETQEIEVGADKKTVNFTLKVPPPQ